MEYEPGLAVQQLMDADAEKKDYRLYLMNGDLSYARGYGALWDTWLYQGKRLMQHMPMMTTPGNHEIDWYNYGFYKGSHDSGGECGVPYAQRFQMPGAWTQQPWYSFDFGPIHFTVMSTEHDFTDGSAQNKWLIADLAGVDRVRTPWVVFVSHRPVYVNANDFTWPDGKQTTAIQLRTALEHILHKYRVDVALAGHHHSYQRTCTVRDGRCRKAKNRHPGAPVYVVHGHAGADFYNNGFDPTPGWLDFNAQTTWGYLRLEVNGTYFQMQSINATSGKVMDEMLLERPVQDAERWLWGDGDDAGGSRGSSDVRTE